MELKFKKIERSDSESLASWLSNDKWPYFLGHTPTKEEVLKRIEEGSYFSDGDLNFWILDSNEELIGLIEIYQLDDLAPMFSIRLKSKCRGKGLGKPALDWLTRYVFENYPDKRRIEGQTREDNVPMRKVFNKCGNVKEAYYRQAILPQRVGVELPLLRLEFLERIGNQAPLLNPDREPSTRKAAAAD